MVEYENYKRCTQIFGENFPSHWKIKPIYGIAHEKKISDCTDLKLLSVYLDLGVIPFSQKVEKRTNVTSLDLSKYQRVDPGDFVLNNQQAWRGSVGVSRYTGIVSPAYIVLELDGGNNSDFMNYMLRSHTMVDQYVINSKSVGSIQRNIHWISIKRTYVPIPPRAEQDQIVRFLDWKVSEINKLIGIRRKEIQELEGLKKVIVHKAITGKNCDTEIRDTSIEWIGAIPAEWEIRHVKNVAIITNGSDPKTEGNIPVYGSGDGSFKTCGEYKEGPAVLIGRKGTIHIPHYVEGKYWNVDTAFDVHMKDDNDLRWFYYLAQCFDYQFYISQTTLPSMTQTDYNNMPIPVPSVPVQHEIASYLDRENLKIDKAIDLTEQKIDALAEMKNTLISDAVTGKIDVRNITVPEYEHVDDIVDDDLENNEETETDGEEA